MEERINGFFGKDEEKPKKSKGKKEVEEVIENTPEEITEEVEKELTDEFPEIEENKED